MSAVIALFAMIAAIVVLVLMLLVALAIVYVVVRTLWALAAPTLGGLIERWDDWADSRIDWWWL